MSILMTSGPRDLHFSVPYSWYGSVTSQRPQMESEFGMTKNHWICPLFSSTTFTDALGERVMCYVNCV